MSQESIFCCNRGATCSNYRQSELVGFKYVIFEEGFVWKNWKTTGIGWIFLLAGEACVALKNGKVMVEAGEMFLLPPSKGDLIALTKMEFIYFISDRPAEYGINLVTELVGKVEKTSGIIEKLVCVSPLKEFLDLLLFYLKTGINCGYLFEEKQEELFIIMSTAYSDEKLTRFFYTLSFCKDNSLRKLIEKNCMNVRSVQELAQLCGYSVSSFKRVFNEIFHEPVYQWMLKKKAEYLKERLTEEGVNLKMIIHEFGFSSPAHFTKFCKQWLGMTPTKFIEKQKERKEYNI